MGAGLLVMSTLLVGLAPAGGGLGDGERVQSTEARPEPAGPADLAPDVRLAVDLPLPVGTVGVDSHAGLPDLPPLPIGARPDPPAIDAPAPASASATGGPLQAIRDAPPAAIVGGTSFL